MKRLVLAIALLVAIPVMLVGCAKSESAAVKDDINGFADAYNAGDYDQCVTYIVGITDANKETIKGTLQGFKLVAQSIEIASVKEIKIDGSTATTKVTLNVTIVGVAQPVEKTIDLSLSKVEGTWEFSLGDLMAAVAGG
jgi:hypothetical protein